MRNRALLAAYSPFTRSRLLRRLSLSTGIENGPRWGDLPGAASKPTHGRFGEPQRWEHGCDKNWLQRSDLNRRPEDYESTALPLRHSAHRSSHDSKSSATRLRVRERQNNDDHNDSNREHRSQSQNTGERTSENHSLILSATAKGQGQAKNQHCTDKQCDGRDRQQRAQDFGRLPDDPHSFANCPVGPQR